LFVRLVRDVAGYNLPVRLNSNDESAAIIAEQCLQIRPLIFGMVYLGKHRLDRFSVCDRRPCLGRNASDVRRLIVTRETDVQLKCARSRLSCTWHDDDKYSKYN